MVLCYMEEKVYFMPGDVVQVRQEIDNKPKMIVKGKETSRFTPNKDEAGKDYLSGIRCIWYDKEQRLQEAVFNTKDLNIVSR